MIDDLIYLMFNMMIITTYLIIAAGLVKLTIKYQIDRKVKKRLENIKNSLLNYFFID